MFHPKKKNKLRETFDCAVRFERTSLNEKLLQGPYLTNTLVGTLLRFREEEIALICDIDSMFYQVRVRQEDTRYLRFLWWNDWDTLSNAVEFKMIVHLFRATSSPNCANFCL